MIFNICSLIRQESGIEPLLKKIRMIRCTTNFLNGAPGRSRTYDLELRKLTLYPTELRARPEYSTRISIVLQEHLKNLLGDPYLPVNTS